MAAVAEDSAIRTLLLVDDEPNVLEGLRTTFRAWVKKGQLRILTAQSADRALEYLAAEPIHIVISDERMPRMSGAEFLMRVAELYPHTIRMMLTGQASLNAIALAINSGRITRFLQKPCPPEALREALDEALRLVDLQAARQEALALLQSNAGLIDLVAPTYMGGGAERLVKNDDGRSFGEALSAGGERPHDFRSLLRTRLSEAEWESLTERELDVLHALMRGYRVSNIAKKLHISVHTVRNHLKALFLKLNTHSQAELVQKCRGA